MALGRLSTHCPPSQYVDYAAAKGAINSFTLGLANEVAAVGIRVKAVRPGIIDAEIYASGGLPQRVRDVRLSCPCSALERLRRSLGHPLVAVGRSYIQQRHTAECSRRSVAEFSP